MAEPIIDTDLPIINHLTFIEAHMFIVGLWRGVDAAIMLATLRPRAARAAVTDMREYIRDVEQTKQRPDLLPGYIRNAWYMVGGFIMGFFGAIAAVGLGLGISVDNPARILDALL